MKTGVDLFFVRGSKWTLFFCADRKLLVFSVNMEIKLVFMMVKIDLISVSGIELELISV